MYVAEHKWTVPHLLPHYISKDTPFVMGSKEPEVQ